jgi:hypothetical protein
MSMPIGINPQPASIPEMSERANALIMRLGLKYKLADEALELKTILNTLLWMLRINSLASSELSERRDANEIDAAADHFQNVTPSLNDLSTLVPQIAQYSAELGTHVAQLINMLEASREPNTPEDQIVPADLTSPPTVDYSSNKPPVVSWKSIKKDHSILLALVRGYRFLLESDDETLNNLYPSRLALISKIRGLELKAISTGTEI